MKKCLVLSTLLLAIGLTGSTALAQSPGTTDASAGAKTGKSAGKSGGKSHNSSGRADAQLADLSQKLSLTDDQKTKIKPILDDQSTQIHTLKKDTTVSKDDQKTKSKTIRDASSQKIRALLTPDQQKTFDGISKKGGKKKEVPAPTPGV
jgi:Spy/CpxP family protein refolding chaperone